MSARKTSWRGRWTRRTRRSIGCRSRRTGRPSRRSWQPATSSSKSPKRSVSRGSDVGIVRNRGPACHKSAWPPPHAPEDLHPLSILSPWSARGANVRMTSVSRADDLSFGPIKGDSPMVSGIPKSRPSHPDRPRGWCLLRFIHVATGTSLVAMLALAIMSPGSAVAGGQFPEVIVLPGAKSAEGIATGSDSTFYAGDLFSGDIFRGDLRTGAVERFIHPPAGRMALGLKADGRHGLLFVAGGLTGQAYIYDLETGADLATFRLGAFINDVVVTECAAWFPDSA